MYSFNLYFMVLSIFQNISLRILIFWQGLFFVLFFSGVFYFGLSLWAFIFGFGLGQVFALISLWLGGRLFFKKISLVTVGLMVFKWVVFGLVLYGALQRVDKMAFLIGLFSLVSFWLAFALGNKK